MKRNFAEALKDLDDDPFKFTETDRKEAKARHLLSENRAERAKKDAEVEAKANALVEKAFEDVVNVAALREYVLEKHPYCAWIGGLDENGDPFYKVLIETPPKLIALMDADKTTFMTNKAMWADLGEDEKRELIAHFRLPEWLQDDADIDPFELLPPASKRFALDWQQQINTGGAYDASQMVGTAADAMLARGYCLHAPNAIQHRLLEGEGTTRQPGRGDIQMGSPGTTGWVRTMMGSRYLNWLLNHEQDNEVSVES